jgi:hypothetical protein
MLMCAHELHQPAKMSCGKHTKQRRIVAYPMQPMMWYETKQSGEHDPHLGLDGAFPPRPCSMDPKLAATYQTHPYFFGVLGSNP